MCDAKLYGERTRVCSSIAPHSSVPYPEKIAELLGDEFVVIVTPADHMCKKCTSLLTHMDKLENDLKLVKNAILSYIQKKYGLLSADQPIKTLDVVNGHLKTEELDVGQRRVPSGLTVKDNSVNFPLKMLKTQHDNSSKMKIYKCGFCAFQSKELGHVRFHMRSHMKKTDGEKANQAVAKPLTPPSLQPQGQQKKRLYRCQVCSASFDSRVECLDHIQKDHNQQAIAINEGKNTANISLSSNTKEILKSDGNQQTVSAMDVDIQQGNKSTMNAAMLLNENVPAERNAIGEHGIKNAVDGGLAQEVAMEIDQDISNNVVKGIGEDMVIGGDNKTNDLDIESMLAAIHSDTPSSVPNIV